MMRGCDSLPENKPIYQQIITIIEDDILNGTYQTDSIIISTTQISKIYSINPTTAVKAISILTDRGILYKKRGIGMAVTEQAKDIILSERQELFFNKQVNDFISAAEKLGINRKKLADIILDEAFGRSTEND